MNCLTTKYLVEIVPPEKFGNANGIVYTARGLGCLIGPYIAGFLSENTQPVYAFVFAGTSCTISFILAIVCVYLHKAEKKNSQQE